MHGRLQIQPHVRSMTDDDGALLLDLKAGKYYSLNGIAAEIWRASEQGATLSEIHADLQERYDTSADRLTGDLDAFVTSMVQKDLAHANG